MRLKNIKNNNFLGSMIFSTLVCSLLFWVVIEKLRSKDFENAALFVVYAFTFMLTVSGLFYTRVQAWPACRMKRRILYAAEHCLGGTAFWGLQILVAAIAFGIYKAIKPSEISEFDYCDIALMFGYFIFNGFKASFDFFYGVRVAIHTKPWVMTPKSFLRSQKNYTASHLH